MKRKAVGIAVAVAALAVLVNVFALKSATVNNQLKNVNIVSTDTALISIASAGASLDADVTVVTSSNEAVITLPAQGVQPGSTYVYAPVLKITNNSVDVVAKDITLTGAPSGVTISLVDANGADIVGTPSVAGSGGTAIFGLKISVPSGTSLSNNDVTLSIKAQ